MRVQGKRTIDLGEALAEGLELIRREDGASEVCGMWVNQRLEAEKDRKPERNHGKRGTRTVIIDGEHLAMPSIADILERQPFQPLPRQTHRGQELGRVAELFVLALAVPAEFLRHDVDHGRERFEGGFRVEETETGAAGDHVDGGRGVFAAAGPGDLWRRVARRDGVGEIGRVEKMKTRGKEAEEWREFKSWESASDCENLRDTRRKGRAPASMYG